jgi:hypothetical protein
MSEDLLYGNSQVNQSSIVNTNLSKKLNSFTEIQTKKGTTRNKRPWINNTNQIVPID